MVAAPSLPPPLIMSSSSSTTFDFEKEMAPVPAVETVKQKDVDALLARELNQMSLKERELVYEEIHGVDRRVGEETPERSQEAMTALNHHLQDYYNDNPNAALTMAFQDNPDYVASLKMMFLRSDFLQADAACQKMAMFMEEKLKLFGRNILPRPIYLSDLDKETMKVLKFGQYQLVPARDSTGRAILCDMHMTGKKLDYENYESVLRAVVYTVLTAVEDEETQKRGMVAVMYYVGKFTGTFDHDLNKRMSKLPKWLPYRLTGFHICFDDPRLRAWKPLAMLLMGKSLRVRLRIHDGTHTEVQYSLMTFGVPVEALPVTYQGELKTTAHLKWIHRRNVKEKALKQQLQQQQQQQQQQIPTTKNNTKIIRNAAVTAGIDLPARDDVILRRGRIFHDHPGNVRMRAYIDMFQPEYKSAPLGAKTAIASKIVQAIKSDGGRFLERDSDGWWIIVSDKEAGKRVCKSIRSARTTMAVAEKQAAAKQQSKEKEQVPPPQPQQHQQQQKKSFFAATEDRKKRAKLNNDNSEKCSSSGEESSCFFPSWKN